MRGRGGGVKGRGRGEGGGAGVGGGPGGGKGRGWGGNGTLSSATIASHARACQGPGCMGTCPTVPLPIPNSPHRAARPCSRVSWKQLPGAPWLLSGTRHAPQRTARVDPLACAASRDREVRSVGRCESGRSAPVTGPRWPRGVAPACPQPHRVILELKLPAVPLAWRAHAVPHGQRNPHDGGDAANAGRGQGPV